MSLDPDLRISTRPTKVSHSKTDRPRYLQAIVALPNGNEVAIVSHSEDGSDSYVEYSLGRLSLWRELEPA